MFTNADQLTSSKRSELLKRIGQEKPLVIAICEIKPKNSKERTTTDYEIPGFSLHLTNIGPDSNTGRGIAVYTHCSIDQSVMQIQPELSYDEVCLLDIGLRGGCCLAVSIGVRNLPVCQSKIMGIYINFFVASLGRNTVTNAS